MVDAFIFGKLAEEAKIRQLAQLPLPYQDIAGRQILSRRWGGGGGGRERERERRRGGETHKSNSNTQ